MTTLRGGGAEVGQWLTAIGSLVARLSEPGSIEVSTLADRPSAGDPIQSLGGVHYYSINNYSNVKIPQTLLFSCDRWMDRKRNSVIAIPATRRRTAELRSSPRVPQPASAPQGQAIAIRVAIATFRLASSVFLYRIMISWVSPACGGLRGSLWIDDTARLLNRLGVSVFRYLYVYNQPRVNTFWWS